MKKKNIIIIVIALCFVLLLFIGYKAFNLNKYANKYLFDESSSSIDNFKINKTINIKSDNNSDYEYLEANGIKIRNDFVNFTYLENNLDENSSTYFLKDYEGNTKASIWFSKSDTYVDELKYFDVNMYDENENVDKKINNDMVSYLESNNIINDIDLIKFISDNKPQINNIFTTTNKMKDNYLLSNILFVDMPSIDSVDLIEGDYEGYIFNISDFRIVNILKDNNRYVVKFMSNDYFNDDYFNELLNTLVIE